MLGEFRDLINTFVMFWGILLRLMGLTAVLLWGKTKTKVIFVSDLTFFSHVTLSDSFYQIQNLFFFLLFLSVPLTDFLKFNITHTPLNNEDAINLTVASGFQPPCCACIDFIVTVRRQQRKGKTAPPWVQKKIYSEMLQMESLVVFFKTCFIDCDPVGKKISHTHHAKIHCSPQP